MAEDQRQAFHTFVQSVEHELIGSVWRILRDTDDSDDAYQQTLVRLWEKFPQVIHHQNPRAFAIRVAVNTALDRYRKRSRKWSLIASDVAPEQISYCKPSDHGDNDDVYHEIMDAIGRLRGRQAEAVIMRFVEDKSYTDIATALGCTEATVRKHIQRARVKLSRDLRHLLDR